MKEGEEDEEEWNETTNSSLFYQSLSRFNRENVDEKNFDILSQRLPWKMYIKGQGDLTWLGYWKVSSKIEHPVRPNWSPLESDNLTGIGPLTVKGIASFPLKATLLLHCSCWPAEWFPLEVLMESIVDG